MAYEQVHICLQTAWQVTFLSVDKMSQQQERFLDALTLQSIRNITTDGKHCQGTGNVYWVLLT